MKRIVWLASYPKSGNTWFRVFLTNYLRNAAEPARINELEATPIASGRHAMDEALGYDSGELTFDEVDALRPDVYRHEAGRAAGRIYRKVHDAWTRLPDGRPLFPPEATVGALYFVRDPRDVCVSFAHHSGHGDFDRLISRMADADFCFCETPLQEAHQLRQRLLTWSGHVRSWVDNGEFPVRVVRYEDMLREPEAAFGAAVEFLGLPRDRERLRRAISFSRFEELRTQEEREGFHERQRGERFFRRGEAGSWRDELTADQAERIIAGHAEVMSAFGYV